MKDLKFYTTGISAAVPSREKIDEQYKWNLADIYKDELLWEEDFKDIEEKIPLYNDFAGRLSQSPGILYSCLKFDDEIGIKLERLYLYAMLSKDSDMKVNKYLAMEGRIKNLASRIAAAGSFIRPELLTMPGEQLLSIINSTEELKVYKTYIQDIIRVKPHTLSKPEEELLALSSEMASTSYTAFSIFTNADLKFPVITSENGDKIEISHARYYAAIYSKDREYRQRAFKEYYKPFISYSNTLSTLFNGVLKSNIFNARARKYSSARESALNRNNIPLSVYDTLISGVCGNLSPLHRWAALKKKILNYKELHPYDMYVSLFSAKEEKEYTYEEAKEIVFDALKPLGPEYLDSLKTAFENRWIDVYETDAKRSGAYSSGTTFGVHPYVLLNWSDLLNDVFTLAHEMGHNMHSYYTGKNQPYIYANYTIFVAEVASTFNESLLLSYLIEKASTPEEKLFLLEKYLNNITATFYRQTMFALFEMKAYEAVEKGNTLTTNELCGMYREQFQKYWGDEMVIDTEEEYTWARIPHFYYNFYVYQYATGFAASEVLANKVKTEGEPAVKKYLNFLKSGSSDYSINLLRNAGVDMESPEPVIAVTKKMNSLLDEIEALLPQIKKG